MQPNQSPDLQRPDQNQVVSPSEPPQFSTSQFDQVTSPTTPAVSGPVDPAAFQAALDEPVSDNKVVTGQPSTQGQDEGVFGDDESVSWTAHEYIHQEKGTKWFVLFALITVGFVVLSVWTQAWSFTALIAVVVFIIVVYLRRAPRELNYSLTEDGLTIDNKLYKYDDFKSFGVIRDGEDFSIMLIPTQRFQPSITVYFPEEAGEDIVDVLGEILPMKDLKLDAVDRLVRMLRL